MLAELLTLARDADLTTFSGRAAQFERDVPFAVFVDALDGYLASQSPQCVDSLTEDQVVELARIFPSLAPLAQGGGAGQSERYRAHYAVGALLGLLATDRPLVLTLDDIQWADQASLELLGYLLRRPPARAHLLALAYRPGEAPGALVEAVDAAARDDGISTIDLGPLDETDATEMISGEVEPEAAAWLFRESGGNPFYLEQLYRTEPGARPPGRASASAGEQPVPDEVSAALAGELAALSPSSRTLIEGASVAGDPFDLELAAAAAGLSEAEGRRALDELLDRELVHPTEAPRRFRFRHPIVHRTVYATTSAGWRIGAHSRVRDVLEQLGARPTELAYHVEQAASRGDEEAIAILERAGHASAELAPGPAADWFGAALRLLGGEEAGYRLELLMPMAAALAASGRLEESRAAMLEALSLLPSDAEPERIGLISALAGVDLLLGRHEEARKRLQSAVTALPDPGSPGVAALRIELAVEALYQGDFDRTVTATELALDGADASDQRPLVAQAEAIRSMALTGLGRIAEADDARTEAANLLDGLDESELADRVDAPFYLGFTEFFLERYEDGAGHLRRGVAIARSAGQGQFLTEMKFGQAWCMIRLGRTREAAELAEDAIEAARVRNPQSLIWALAIRSWIARFAGDLELARSTGEEGVAIGADLDESVILATARAQLALACADAGDYAQCLSEMERAGAPDFPLFSVELKPYWYEGLSRAALGLGRHAEAERWVARAESLVEGLALPVAVAAARQARARLLLAGDQADGAAELALEAAALQESRRARIEAARSRILAGRALAVAGRHERAVEVQRRAFGELDACGADRHRDEAARELRKLGKTVPRVAPRPRAAAGVSALSEREREIADLVAEAKTNREVAATLFISEKTVEKHLTKVFAKLGVKGRAAIGAKLASQEGEPQK